MNSRAFRRSAVAVAALSASAIVLAGCAGGGGTEPSADSDEPITLTVTTFNDFGYDDTARRSTWTRTRTSRSSTTSTPVGRRPHELLRRSSARSGLADVEAVEEDWFTEVMQVSDLLAEVPDERQGPLGRLEGSRRRPTPTAASSATAPTSARRASATTADALRGRRPAHRPRRGRRALGRRRLGHVLRPRQPVPGRDRQGR